MKRPNLEVADILRVKGEQFLERYRNSFSFQQVKAFSAIRNCRTPALGGHLDTCPGCGYQAAISYNSCRNRHCPKCQAQARKHWIQAREQELINSSYFHVVFTVPHELNLLALQNQRLFYDLLFSAAAQTTIEVAANPQHLGASIGLILVLHTWGQNLLLHPHVHCVVPAGGMSPDYAHWVRSASSYFLPVRALRKVFRGKFTDGLKQLYKDGKLHLRGPAAVLAQPRQFKALLRRLHRPKWVVYVKPTFGGPLQVLRYLGRYTHRVAISNHRLVAFDGERVSFRWRDYAHGNQHKTMTLEATEFLRRFFLHVLPKGFVRIRYYGFLTNRFRHSLLPLCQQLAGATNEVIVSPPADANPASWYCPRCGTALVVVERFTGRELAARRALYDSS
jgi:hypothetical protein